MRYPSDWQAATRGLTSSQELYQGQATPLAGIAAVLIQQIWVWPLSFLLCAPLPRRGFNRS